MHRELLRRHSSYRTLLRYQASSRRLSAVMLLTLSDSRGLAEVQQRYVGGHANYVADLGHHLTVQMPSGVPEHRHDKDETKERGY